MLPVRTVEQLMALPDDVTVDGDIETWASKNLDNEDAAQHYCRMLALSQKMLAIEPAGSMSVCDPSDD